MPAEAPPLDGLDLNLLVTLRALLLETSVTRAAVRIGQSQPTVSRALQSLRSAFGDELLTRSGRSMTLTPMAEALREPLERFLNAANRLATVGAFDPATAERTFHLSLPDIVAFMLVPNLTERIVEAAPRCRLVVVGAELDQLDGLLSGSVDMAVGSRLDHAELMGRSIGSDDGWGVLVGPAHPSYEAETLELDAWLSSKHVQLVPHGRPSAPSAVDEFLKARGLHRSIVVQLGHITSIPRVLRQAPLVLSLPYDLATGLGREEPELRLFRHPLGDDLPRAGLALMWHESMQHDAGHAWLRDHVIAAYA